VSSPEEWRDIVIVGAGIAGLYCCWRLLEAGVSPDRIGFFEAADRTGGRILGATWPGDPGCKAEMGAHFLNSGHVLSNALAADLGLATEPAIVFRDHNIVHLRGCSRTRRQISRAWFRKPFDYRVSRYLQRRGIRKLLEKAVRASRRAGHERDRELRFDPPYDQLPLNEAFSRFLTDEELRLLADRLGYSFLHEQLHGNATLAWMADGLFGVRMSWPSSGMSALTDALRAAIEAHGMTIRLGHRLSRVTAGKDGNNASLEFTSPGRMRTIEAGSAVLALPPHALKQVEGLGDDDTMAALFGAVAQWPIATAAVVYPEPWWIEAGFAEGRISTDLAVGQIGIARRHGPETGSQHAALEIYTEGERSGFWRTLLRAGENGQWLGKDHAATREIHRQILKVFDGRLTRNPPLPVDAVVQDWQADPFGGAFHLWRHGSTPESAIERARDPVPGLPLSICGEAWSLQQGWIEGALQTAEQVLVGKYGLAPYGTAEAPA
jgi:monoamine oxidase